MPYKRVKNKVYHYKNGKWSLKQTAKNVTNAKTIMRILKGLEKSERA